MHRYPKVFQIGDKYTENLFNDNVSVTEKVDGSQLNVSLCSKNGLTFLTKASTTHQGDGNKLFAPAVDYFTSISNLLTEDWTYHGETLCAPRHNTLAYDRVPKNHFALYGVTKKDGSPVGSYEELQIIANSLDVDVVPELYNGKVDNIGEFIEEWLNKESYLGKEKIEGIVAKRYNEEIFVGGRVIPFLQGKYVSSKFKERHSESWPNANKGPLAVIGEMVRTEARWMKAIQHLKESGEWEQHPRDIGKLLKYLHQDLEEEDKEILKEKLWNAFSKEIKRAATRSFPEAYKMYLATGELKMNVVGDDFMNAGIK